MTYIRGIHTYVSDPEAELSHTHHTQSTAASAMAREEGRGPTKESSGDAVIHTTILATPIQTPPSLFDKSSIGECPCPAWLPK